LHRTQIDAADVRFGRKADMPISRLRGPRVQETLAGM
jgi:hypothetical protein